MIAKTGKQPGALVGIVYHEVGHSLLSLWGLPGHNNEDTADEFAVQLALRTPNEAKIIDQFASFFESGDPWMEARVMIEQGDRHSLGVQRVRNIRSALKAPKELTDRWNELTYPANDHGSTDGHCAEPRAVRVSRTGQQSAFQSAGSRQYCRRA